MQRLAVFQFLDHDNVEYTKVKINPGDRHKVEFNVEKEKSMGIKWTFKSEGHDIGFGIFYEKKDAVVPKKRVEANRSIQSGSFLCEEKGLFTVVFDNTYSFARGKTIFYDIKLVSKEEIARDEELMHKIEEEIQKTVAENEQLHNLE